MSDWIEKVSNWPWREWAGPLITGAFTVTLAVMTGWTKLKEIKANSDKSERETAAKVDETQTNDLTQRFRALMDGYEATIKDLREDNARLRELIHDIEREFENYRGICEGCSKRAAKLREIDGRST